MILRHQNVDARAREFLGSQRSGRPAGYLTYADAPALLTWGGCPPNENEVVGIHDETNSESILNAGREDTGRL